MSDVRRIANGEIDKELDQKLHDLKEKIGITDSQIEAIATGGVNDLAATGSATFNVSAAEERSENYQSTLKQLVSDEFLESFERAAERTALFRDDILELLEGSGTDVILTIDQVASRSTSELINHLVEFIGEDDVVKVLKGTASDIGVAAKLYYDKLEQKYPSSDGISALNNADDLVKKADSWVERTKPDHTGSYRVR